jgi:hypothetical protein
MKNLNYMQSKRAAYQRRKDHDRWWLGCFEPQLGSVGAPDGAIVSIPPMGEGLGALPAAPAPPAIVQMPAMGDLGFRQPGKAQG